MLLTCSSYMKQFACYFKFLEFEFQKSVCQMSIAERRTMCSIFCLLFGCRAGLGHVVQAPLADGRAQQLPLQSLSCALASGGAAWFHHPKRGCEQKQCFTHVFLTWPPLPRAPRLVPLGCLIHLRTLLALALCLGRSEVSFPATSAMQ